MKNIKLDIVVPVLNEESNIEILYKKIVSLNLELDFNIIFVDDGSTDSTLKVIKKLNSIDNKVKVISFSRNFGHQIALSAGIDHSNSDILIMLDADLQHPPEEINTMIKKYTEGFDVVQMIKENQGKRNIFYKLFSYIFYEFFKKTAGVKLSNNVSDFRLISKKVTNEIKKLNEKERFLRGIVQWVGFKYTEIQYKVGERYSGTPKYNLLQLFKLASFGIFGFSTFPLKLSLYSGLIISLFSIFYVIYLIIAKLLNPENYPSGFTSIMVMIIFVGGIQLFFLGSIGMYISKIFDQVKDRPIYIIKEKIL